MATLSHPNPWRLFIIGTALSQACCELGSEYQLPCFKPNSSNQINSYANLACNNDSSRKCIQYKWTSAFACCLLLLCTAPLSPPPPPLNTMSNLTNLVTTLRLARTQHCKNVVTGKTYNSGALSWLVTYCLLHFR